MLWVYFGCWTLVVNMVISYLNMEVVSSMIICNHACRFRKCFSTWLVLLVLNRSVLLWQLVITLTLQKTELWCTLLSELLSPSSLSSMVLMLSLMSMLYSRRCQTASAFYHYSCRQQHRAACMRSWCEESFLWNSSRNFINLYLHHLCSAQNLSYSCRQLIPFISECLWLLIDIKVLISLVSSSRFVNSLRKLGKGRGSVLRAKTSRLFSVLVSEDHVSISVPHDISVPFKNEVTISYQAISSFSSVCHLQCLIFIEISILCSFGSGVRIRSSSHGSHRLWGCRWPHSQISSKCRPCRRCSCFIR